MVLSVHHPGLAENHHNAWCCTYLAVALTLPPNQLAPVLKALGVSHELVGGKTKQGNGDKLVRFELKLLQLDMTAVKSNVIVLLFQQWDAHCGHDHIMTGREIGERSRRWR